MTTRHETVGVHYDSCYERHLTGIDHTESPERYQWLRKALETLPPEFIRLPGREATVEEILLAHDHWYHDLVFRDVETFADQLRTGDTPICEESYDVAREASGTLLEAIDRIMRGEVTRAFCAVRPPGHHASSDKGMGFCIFNHVAIAARYLQRRHGLTRIAIIDWDAHHGNGTQAIFLNDPQVLYISLHEDGTYPFTGAATERGEGPGEGATLNLPLPAGSDGDHALTTWDANIPAAMDAFQPEFILISAGFDAHAGDPLGHLAWDENTFAALTRRAVALASKWCDGRLLSSLEGGYHPDHLANSAMAHVMALPST